VISKPIPHSISITLHKHQPSFSLSLNCKLSMIFPRNQSERIKDFFNKHSTITSHQHQPQPHHITAPALHCSFLIRIVESENLHFNFNKHFPLSHPTHMPIHSDRGWCFLSPPSSTRTHITHQINHSSIAQLIDCNRYIVSE
jgi:hypothetical protein